MRCILKTIHTNIRTTCSNDWNLVSKWEAGMHSTQCIRSSFSKSRVSLVFDDGLTCPVKMPARKGMQDKESHQKTGDLRRFFQIVIADTYSRPACELATVVIGASRLPTRKTRSPIVSTVKATGWRHEKEGNLWKASIIGVYKSVQSPNRMRIRSKHTAKGDRKRMTGNEGIVPSSAKMLKFVSSIAGEPSQASLLSPEKTEDLEASFDVDDCLVITSPRSLSSA
mmetsp:Transcript_911/g.1560  ORF Transcript_911/g.1560 Transcript_911/m.1560 type:complete len:225 (-) Transcript_911:266-940(-)